MCLLGFGGFEMGRPVFALAFTCPCAVCRGFVQVPGRDGFLCQAPRRALL